MPDLQLISFPAPMKQKNPSKYIPHLKLVYRISRLVCSDSIFFCLNSDALLYSRHIASSLPSSAAYSILYSTTRPFNSQELCNNSFPLTILLQLALLLLLPIKPRKIYLSHTNYGILPLLIIFTKVSKSSFSLLDDGTTFIAPDNVLKHIPQYIRYTDFFSCAQPESLLSARLTRSREQGFSIANAVTLDVHNTQVTSNITTLYDLDLFASANLVIIESANISKDALFSILSTHTTGPHQIIVFQHPLKHKQIDYGNFCVNVHSTLNLNDSTRSLLALLCLAKPDILVLSGFTSELINLGQVLLSANASTRICIPFIPSNTVNALDAETYISLLNHSFNPCVSFTILT